MMVEIQIGELRRNLNEVRENWITTQINRRRADGQTVCVRVIIREGSLNISFSTPTCPGRRTGEPAIDNQVKEIVAIWNKNHLNESDFTGGNLIAFLKQLRRLI